MRFSDLCEKEVISVNDCRCLGNVRDLDIDQECGKVKALIIPGPGKYFGLFCKDSEFLSHGVKLFELDPI